MSVRTQYGPVEGGIEKGIAVWRGIPFAAPPIGVLRWQPPQPPEPWRGVRQCREFSAIPPQPELNLDSPVKVRLPQSEDCLYLNIYAPENYRQRNLPVLFWIYGGGFIAGTANIPLYDLPRIVPVENVIMVTCNYRIGLLGFTGEANYGLMDQFAALQWVRQNIREFGGDPENITLIGESAGAISVDAFMRSPLTQGTFKRAICQSGSLESLKALIPKQNGLNLPPNAAAMSPDELITYQSKFFGWHDSEPKHTCIPVYDNQWCTSHYHNPVPLLTGTNSNEETVFTNHVTPEDFSEWSEKVFNKVITKRIIKRYQNDEAWNAVIRYGTFVLPVRRLADTVNSHKQPVYLYHFNRQAPEVQYAKRLKCYHASEISYIFGNPLTPPPPEDVALSEQMMKYWANFARTGNPNSDDLPAWPLYTHADRRNILLDIPISTERDYAAEDCNFFEELINMN